MNTEFWSCDAGGSTAEFAVHVEGNGPPLVLVHGIGPGTSVLANFQSVLPALARQRTVYGIDLIGFGASPIKQHAPLFDFPLWGAQVREAMRRLAQPGLALWGQSIGAAVVLKACADAAEAGPQRVVCTGAGGGLRDLNDALSSFWRAPRTAQEMHAAMAQAVFDASSIEPAQIEQRFGTLTAGGKAAYFDAMMAGDRRELLQSCWLSPQQLSAVRARVLLLHGREDKPVPYRESALHLFEHLPDARLVLLSQCGHNPLLEHRDEVLACALAHLDG